MMVADVVNPECYLERIADRWRELTHGALPVPHLAVCHRMDRASFIFYRDRVAVAEIAECPSGAPTAHQAERIFQGFQAVLQPAAEWDAAYAAYQEPHEVMVTA